MSTTTEREWSPETGDVVPSYKPPAGLVQANFRDEQGAGQYHLEIPVKGGLVFAREMDDALYADYLRRRAAYREVLDSAPDREREAMSLDKLGQYEEAMEIRLASQKQTEAAQKGNIEFTQLIIARTLAGWSFNRPFSLEAYKQLRGDDQQSVLTKVINASGIGRDEEDFLASDSLTP